MLRQSEAFSNQYRLATLAAPQRQPPGSRTMIVIQQHHPEPTPIAGIEHSTWAGEADGLSQLSVWRQTLAPGAASPPHRHDCDEVVMCLAGCGEVHTEGQVHRFGADTTLALPGHKVHQLFNVGPLPLELLAVLAATPVHTEFPDGQTIDLPWRT
jgi:quercetin dioxygenase-like cupin family protein